jgi:hypothetical protein
MHQELDRQKLEAEREVRLLERQERLRREEAASELRLRASELREHELARKVEKDSKERERKQSLASRIYFSG